MTVPLSSAAREGASRWAVLGASGQLGRALLAVGRAHGQPVIGLTRAELDVSNRSAVIGTLAALRPDLVINAAAFTAVDQAESEPRQAFAVNRDGAAHAAEACAALDIPMIHISTDYVFDGGSTKPYVEDDEPAPLSVYGLSKAEGERLVRDRHERCAILRTSWLFGIDGRNFVKTIANLARDRDELRVVADQRGCPTPAADLATAIIEIGRLMLAERSLRGLFHFSGLEPTSWHGFAEAVVEMTAPRCGRRPRVVPITTQEYPTPARRPRNSVLDCRKLAMLGVNRKSWRPGLSDVIEQLFGKDARPVIAAAGSSPCPIFS